MASRRIFNRGTKRKSTSPHNGRRRNEKFPTNSATHWRQAGLFSPVGSSLNTIRNTTRERVPNKQIREQILRDELIKVGNYVDQYLSYSGSMDPEFASEESLQQCWEIVVSYWPDSGTSASQIQRMYEAQPQAGPRPFLKSGLGRLPPEIRQQIYNNLLAIPPPYTGRDYRAHETQILDKSPISLATFVDLRASCLVVLLTCRQIYHEAFPAFYAAKSYYFANPRDLARFSRYEYLKKGPQLCRVDTITSLCLINIVVNRLVWTPDSIDRLISQHPNLTFDREALETERVDELDTKLTYVDFGDLKNLRKICLCMRVGQEWEHLQFLFNIRGLNRGIIEFVDDFHWTIRSQSLSGGDWNIQYSAFPNVFYGKGKNFEELDLHDSDIQGEVLNIDSRASDLVEGDERWVEVDIGSRDYQEWPEWLEWRQRTRDVVQGNVSTNGERPPGGEDIGFSTDDESNLGSEYLQGIPDGEEDGTQADREIDQESDDAQGQLEEEDRTRTDNLKSRNLQGQADGEHEGAKSDEEPDEESARPEILANGDSHNAQARSYTNPKLETSQGPPAHQDFINTEGRNVLAANESTQGPEDSAESVNDKTTYVQAKTDPLRLPAILPKEGNKDDLEAESSESETHRDASTQTKSVESEIRCAEASTEPGELAEDLSEDRKSATAPTQRDVLPDQVPDHQPEVQDGQRISVQPKLKPVKKPQVSAILQPEKKTSIKLPQKKITSPIPDKPKTSLASVDDSTPKKTHQPPLASHKRRYLYGCIRVGALAVGLFLLYVVLYAKWESALSQLLALMLFILLSFMAGSLDY